MTVQINDREVVSSVTGHRADLLPSGSWAVTWLPGRRLTRAQAVTAIIMAAAVTQQQAEHEWAHITRWARALDVAPLDAISRIRQPLGTAPPASPAQIAADLAREHGIEVAA